MASAPDQDAAGPSSSKKSQVEFSERDAPDHRQESVSNINSPATATRQNTATGSLPTKVHTPVAEHLRYGHIDFEEVEESEQDKRRHYFIRKPKVKQWFYKGKLFRSAEGRSSARIELFFDLIFVAIIAVLAEAAIENPNGHGLVRYIITYWAAYSIWSGLRENMNMFWNDDVLQKTFVMWMMILLITYGNNAPFIADAPREQEPATSASEAEVAAEGGEAIHRLFKKAAQVGSTSHHYEGGGRTTTILVYIVADLSLVIGRMAYSFYVHQVRQQLRIQSFLTIIPVALYIGAIFTSVGAAIALVVVGLALEYALWVAVYSPHLKRLMKLEYSSALNIEHEIDRHADFYTIVIGEFIYSSVSGAPAGLGIDRATGRAALVLLIAASLQFLYMFSSGCVHFVHPLRHSGNYATLWFVLHMPAVAALTLCGDAGAILIASETGVAQGVRWFFCGGISVGLFSIGLLALLEREKDDNILVMRKRYRLIPSTNILGIAAALLYATLIYETIFGLHRREHVTGKPATGWRRYLPQFFDPELAHRDVHKEGEETFDERQEGEDF